LLGAILTDLSEQRQMEERLRQAQKMEAVGQLTGGLAHDFNNLLQAICGNLNLIKLRPDDGARAQKWAEKGLQAAQRGAKLTSQLLAFSRLQQVDLKPLNASALVSGMLDLLRHTLGPGIEIVYALDDSDAAVLADQTQLELAVLNLAINARDAMPNGGVLKIATALRTVRNDAELVSDEYLELSVSDSGAGMPESVRSRAFDPFFTTKGVGQGTGLGLAQVYGIAHQAGGTARIESEAGKGTTVTLLLRRSRESACDCLNAEDNEGAAEIKKTAKVLVIDDDDDVLGFLVESLQLLGYTVSSASDGMAGLAMMAADPPDILLIDYAMPKLNGAEVVKLAREKGLMMPVIFASGYSDMSALDEAVGLKANLILKPFTIANLSAELQKVLLSEHAPAM
jgi:nitrogen-specific signal transduction histidine kinase/ActR/RegA family two-component response regulator